MPALDTIRSIAILRGITAQEIPAVGEALAEAGVDIIEVTLNTPGALPMIETLAKMPLANTLIGAGTVTRTEQAQQVADAGGKIAISPNTDAAVIKASKAAGLISLPGFLTPTEAYAALNAGADGLKLFPCEMASPAALKAMKAILPPELPVFAVGGVGAHNAADFLEVGAQGLGVGSAIYKAGKSIEQVSEDARRLVEVLSSTESGDKTDG
ncbi:2-dehydro-3-deoxy-6-phosphogalactonate aldolase [Erythrobacter sp. W53]|uniref:2-dehydro-3-deoxy-6-phosphogalactonate aldolase n=1 Tax=Erythrobacter sp. W53 TaxID=3425947 RepID=UPI003D7687AB